MRIPGPDASRRGPFYVSLNIAFHALSPDVRYYGAMRYTVLSKMRGQTPLQAIDAWRQAHPALKDIAATYAGRLDPMATGKLLVLLGDECKKQVQYRHLDKEYLVELLLDFSTDTGDVLGIPLYRRANNHPHETQIAAAISKEVGTRQVSYPAFSSKTVKGKPLFQYALGGTLGDIDIPVHTEIIYDIKLLGSEHIKKEALQERVGSILAVVPRTQEASKVLGADFRQDQIRAAWETLFADTTEQEFLVLKLRVVCASGTYMRTLAERIGTRLNTTGVALSIHRTKIGRYQHLPFFGFWSRLY